MDERYTKAKMKYLRGGSIRPQAGFISGLSELNSTPVISETDNWHLVQTGEHSSELVWKDDGIFGNAEPIKLGFIPNEQSTKKHFQCPRGHSFATSSPIVIAVDEDPEFNSGPICSYCYVNWFRANLNATEVTDDT